MAISKLLFDPTLSQEELRGFSRTVAEIEWLMLILVLLFQTVLVPDQEASAALAMAMLFFTAFILAFHYANLHRTVTPWQIGLETIVMIIFITWVLVFTGRLDSPLLNLYLLVVVTSALALGKTATAIEIAIIAGCYLWLGAPKRHNTAVHFTAEIVAHLAPMLLVAYITTMLSTDMRRVLVRIKQLAETDELTGLLNMRAFSGIADRLSKQATRYQRPFAVLMIDSDSLKSVNDRFGHECGNRLLRLAVQCIQSQLRDTDIVARYGGDEFVVMLPETTCNHAMSVAARIRQTIESTPLMVDGNRVQTTVSIGLAAYPDHGDALQDVMEKADQAMYASKTGGRNRLTISGAAAAIA